MISEVEKSAVAFLESLVTHRNAASNASVNDEVLDEIDDDIDMLVDLIMEVGIQEDDLMAAKHVEDASEIHYRGRVLADTLLEVGRVTGEMKLSYGL